MSDGNLTDDEITDFINEGLRLGRQELDENVALLLGESAEAWFGAGVMATWIRMTMQAVDSLADEEDARKTILLIAVQVRAMLEHPMALAALERRQPSPGRQS
jgi:hypothetical protein